MAGPFYVRKSGNDGNAGTSPATAKLTVDAGEALFTPGGTELLYVGPGTYREKVTAGKSGASLGSEHQIIADIFGDYTGDAPGIVRITASDNDSSFVRSSAIEADASHQRWIGFLLDGGSTSVVELTPSATRSNWILEDCLLDPWGGPATLYSNPSFDAEAVLRRCIIKSFLNGKHFEQAGTNTITLLLEACYIEGVAGNDAGGSHFSCSGVGVLDLTLRHSYLGPIPGQVFYRQGGTFTALARNCVIRMGDGIKESGTPTLDTDYNHYEGNNLPSLNTNETAGWSGNGLLWALLRRHAVYQLIRPDGGVAISGVSDIFGRSIPQGSGSSLGPAENQDYPIKDQSIFGTAAPSMASQPGRRLSVFRTWLVKGGQSNSFSVKMRYNTAYTVSPKPRMTIKANPLFGLAADVVIEADVTALNAFAIFGDSITPTVSGEVELWFQTFSTEASAQGWFDDLVGPTYP